MEAVRTSETSVDNNFTRQYIPEDNSEHHTRRRENFKSHKVYKVLVGKPEGKRPLGRPRRRWEDGLTVDLREIGWGGVWSEFSLLRMGAGCGLL
jgi:hypothetical protein